MFRARTARMLLLGMGLMLAGCRSNATSTAMPLTATLIPTGTSVAAVEQPVTVIPLAGDLAGRTAEVSGTAWYGDYLIILPQYPGRFSSQDDGRVFAIPKEDLCAFLDGSSDAPLIPQEIPFVAPGLAGRITGFEGYEAIAFLGERAFLTIEARAGAGMRGYLVAGEIAPDLSALRLEVDGLTEMAPQADLSNMAYESLLIAGDALLTLYEANGVAVNPGPVAKRFDLSLAPLAEVTFPPIEYRVTDATALDSAGHFWVINYFYPGDIKLKPAPDPLVAQYGAGPTHARFKTVERLVQLQYTPAGISLVATPPIQLELIDDDHARNWEGLVRLDDRGFLLMTDQYPETILAFVPLP